MLVLNTRSNQINRVWLLLACMLLTACATPSSKATLLTPYGAARAGAELFGAKPTDQVTVLAATEPADGRYVVAYSFVMNGETHYAAACAGYSVPTQQLHYGPQVPVASLHLVCYPWVVVAFVGDQRVRWLEWEDSQADAPTKPRRLDVAGPVTIQPAGTGRNSHGRILYRAFDEQGTVLASGAN